MAVKLFPEFPERFRKLPISLRCLLLELRASWALSSILSKEELLFAVGTELFMLEQEDGTENLTVTDDGEKLAREVLSTFKPVWRKRLEATLQRANDTRKAEFLSVKQKELVMKEFTGTMEKYLVRQWRVDFNGSKKVIATDTDLPDVLKNLAKKSAWVLGVIAGAEEVPAAYFRKYNGGNACMELSQRKLVKIVNVKEPKYVLTDLGKEVTALYYMDPDVTEEGYEEGGED